MDFSCTDEQRAVADTIRRFVDTELVPYEEEVERRDDVPDELAHKIRTKAVSAGLYAPNMPQEVGGGGLDAVALTLAERELGKTSFGLQMLVGRPATFCRPARAPSASATCCRPSAANGTSAWR